MHDLLLRNVRPMAGERCDILIKNGQIAGFGTFEAEPGMAVEDGDGAIVVPGLIDARPHLDKTTWGMLPGMSTTAPPSCANGSISSGKTALPSAWIHTANRCAIAIGLAANGGTHIRSHVDIDPAHGLSLVEGVWETREKLKGIIDIEIVAFPQSGVMVMPGTVELLDETLRQGCEVLGGIDPCGIDRDPRGPARHSL